MQTTCPTTCRQRRAQGGGSPSKKSRFFVPFPYVYDVTLVIISCRQNQQKLLVLLTGKLDLTL